MARDHFSKAFQSPYFQSNFYKNETAGGKMETKIENILNKIFKRGKNVSK
jgi:hypothetical protein